MEIKKRQIKKINKFINTIERLKINSIEYIETKAGWLRKNEYPNIPFTNKSYLWEIESIGEEELITLQKEAIKELKYLTPYQLQLVLISLEMINKFSNFNDFMKIFYVKVEKKEYNGLDVSDFKIKLDSCFFTEIPKTGFFDINFLNKLLPQIILRHSLLNELRVKIEKQYFDKIQLIEAPQQKDKSKKTLFQFIHNIEDKEAFLLELKKTFPTEIGKDIRVIIDTLIKENILIIGAREYKHFVEVLSEYFGRNIGKYQGIQNKMKITNEISDPINKKLNPLIVKYKTI